jgi:hypothetical protein
MERAATPPAAPFPSQLGPRYPDVPLAGRGCPGERVGTLSGTQKLQVKRHAAKIQDGVCGRAGALPEEATDLPIDRQTPCTWSAQEGRV